MSPARRTLLILVATLAVGMSLAAAVAATGGWDEDRLKALAAIEVCVSAVLLLPWCFVFGRRAALGFAPGEAGSMGWRVLAFGSLALMLGQFVAFVPHTIDCGPYHVPATAIGQMLPAVFRLAMCWALFQVRSSFLATGLPFRLHWVDLIAGAGVAIISAQLFFRSDVAGQYFLGMPMRPGEPTPFVVALAQGLNFVLYPIVFFLSLTIFRYSRMMRGGLASWAWGGIALYGLLQPLHVFLVTMLVPDLGNIFLVAFDSFVILAAFASLAFGPVYQVEAAELCAAPSA